MKRCPNCNIAYSDVVKVCSACGTDLSGNAAPIRPQKIQNHTQNYTQVEQHSETRVVQGQVVNTPAQTNQTNDSGHLLWGVFGFILPFPGLIMYLIWRKTKPLTASMVGKGSAIGYGVSFALSVLAGFLGSI